MFGDCLVVSGYCSLFCGGCLVVSCCLVVFNVVWILWCVLFHVGCFVVVCLRVFAVVGTCVVVLVVYS